MPKVKQVAHKRTSGKRPATISHSPLSSSTTPPPQPPADKTTDKTDSGAFAYGSGEEEEVAQPSTVPPPSTIDINEADELSPAKLPSDDELEVIGSVSPTHTVLKTGRMSNAKPGFGTQSGATRMKSMTAGGRANAGRKRKASQPARVINEPNTGAASGKRKSKEEPTSPVFINEKPRFISIITEDTLPIKELVLPRQFVRESDVCRSDKMTIKFPSGNEWQMKLSRCGGSVSLQSGWQKFADFHSLKSGHLLAFTYEGDSKFSVHIYDGSSCEIFYPMPITINEESEDSDDSIIRLVSEDPSDSSMEQQAGTEDSSDGFGHECMQPRESFPTQSSCSYLPRPARMKRMTAGGRANAGRKRKASQPARVIMRIGRDEKQRILEERTGALRFNNHYFRLVMQASYLPPRSKLQIPASFSRKFFKVDVDDVGLETDNGSWSVTYHAHQSRGKPRSRFMRGWSTFAKDNALKVGDVCIFEWLGENRFKVHIERMQ